MIDFVQISSSNGKCLSMQQATGLLFSDFPLGSCDHSSLMERDHESDHPQRPVVISHSCFIFTSISIDAKAILVHFQRPKVASAIVQGLGNTGV